MSRPFTFRPVARGVAAVLVSLSAACGGADVDDGSSAGGSGSGTSASSASASSTSTGATGAVGAGGGSSTSGASGGGGPSTVGSGGAGGASSSGGSGGDGGGSASSTTSGIGEPPAVNINHPSDGQARPADQLVPLVGVAVDAEDGDLGEQIVWTSDLDGELGTGAAFDVLLSEGVHVLSVEVIDSDGNLGSDAIAVTME